MSGGRALRLIIGKKLDPAVLGQLRKAALDLMDEAKVPAKQRPGLSAVVEELGTNVMEHSGAAWMELAVVTADGKIFLSISDNGKAFDPVSNMQSRDFSGDLGNEEGRNLGFYMLKNLTQSMRYLREEGGVNRVMLQLA